MINNHEIIKSHIKRRFNKAAVSYNQNNAVQLIAGDKLIQDLLHYGNQFDSIIDLGCGTGVVTKKLAEAMHYKSFQAIDIAPNLLILAKAELSNYPVVIQQSDFDNFTFFHNRFNLVFSNMALQWSLQFANTVTSIYDCLNSDGLFAFSLPIAGTFPELNPALTLSFYSIEAIASLLMTKGFTILYSSTQLITSQFDSLMLALKSIQKVGASCRFNQTNSSLRGKSFLNNIAAEKFTDHTAFSLTYNVGYIIARKC